MILGAASGAVVTSLGTDVLMPPVGKLIRGVDFANLFVVLDGRQFSSLRAAKDAGAATINYGIFLNTLITFVIVRALHERARTDQRPGGVISSGTGRAGA